MTQHVEHTNLMVGQLKQYYTDRIDCLKQEISKKQDEIDLLKSQIEVICNGKVYDC